MRVVASTVALTDLAVLVWLRFDGSDETARLQKMGNGLGLVCFAAYDASFTAVP